VRLEAAFADGQLAALRHHKLAWPAPTNPTVANSAVLRSTAAPSTSPEAYQAMKPPTTPHELAQVFDAHEQGKTRTEPRRKLSADICTSCRKDKHYGPCKTPRPIPVKAADFNMGMRGDDPTGTDNPSTSPNYHSATSADSALARARDGRPADEQAGSAFADLYRHLGISNAADEPGRMTGGLNKVAEVLNIAKLRERRAAILEKMFAVSKLADSKESALGLGAIQFFNKNLGTQGGIDFLDKHHYRQQGIPQNFKPGAPVARQMPAAPPPAPTAGPSSKVVVDPSLFHPPQGAARTANWQLWGTDGHSTHEDRGPSPNPYEERKTVMSRPIGWGDEGEQRIKRTFDQIDGAADTTNVGGGFGDPQPGPAALG
jgi:hypothetical protein